MADNIAKVVMIDRSVYDNLNPPENNTIYFVREGSPYTSKALSLYVGEAKQCDLIDITGETTFDPQTNEYSIPQAYRIDGKLLFSQQTIVTEKLNPGDQKTDDNSYSFFRISMWDSTSGKFKDCTGFPNNVILVKDGQLPYTGSQGVPGDAIKDFVYIDIMNRNIYVFDGNSYIPLVNLSEYATQEWVLEQISGISVDVNVDNITILKDTISGTSNVLHGAGADVTGKQYTIDDVSVTAGNGAHVFNAYSNDPYNENKVTRPYSSAFGNMNTEKPCPVNRTNGSNLISGYNNTVKGADRSAIFGSSNNINFSGNGLRMFVYGVSNDASGSGDFDLSYGPVISMLGYDNGCTITGTGQGGYEGTAFFISGYKNEIDASEQRHCTILGAYNHFTASGGSDTGHTTIDGEQNSVTNAYGYSVFGYQNTVTNTSGTVYMTQGSVILGSYNSVDGVWQQGTCLIGHSNSVISNGSGRSNHCTIIGSNNSMTNISATSYSVSECAVQGNANLISCNTSNVQECTVIGRSLYSEWSKCLVLGSGNTHTLPEMRTGSNPTIIVGNGNYSLGNYERNAAILTTDNELLCYADITDASTEISLKSKMIVSQVTPSNGAVVLATLPKNGDETILETPNNEEIKTITISSLTVPIIQSTADVGIDVANGEVADYCATIAFRPNASTPITDVTTLLTNFAPSGSEPRIYLTNSSVDISSYSVIHLLLFFDGFNVCCTVAGYEEVPST